MLLNTSLLNRRPQQRVTQSQMLRVQRLKNPTLESFEQWILNLEKSDGIAEATQGKYSPASSYLSQQITCSWETLIPTKNLYRGAKDRAQGSHHPQAAACEAARILFLSHPFASIGFNILGPHAPCFCRIPHFCHIPQCERILYNKKHTVCSK